MRPVAMAVVAYHKNKLIKLADLSTSSLELFGPL